MKSTCFFVIRIFGELSADLANTPSLASTLTSPLPVTSQGKSRGAAPRRHRRHWQDNLACEGRTGRGNARPRREAGAELQNSSVACERGHEETRSGCPRQHEWPLSLSSLACLSSLATAPSPGKGWTPNAAGAPLSEVRASLQTRPAPGTPSLGCGQPNSRRHGTLSPAACRAE